MPFFSRRILQRLLDETQYLLNEEQIRARLALLNSNNRQAIDAEWEVAILSALDKIAHVTYEPALGGSTRPDLLVSVSNLEFVADIRTVSDSGYEESNPLQRFQAEFWRRVRKAGVAVDGIHAQLGVHGSKGRRVLFVPSAARWDDFFDCELSAFLRDIQQRPSEALLIHHKAPGINIKVSFTPGKQNGGFGYSGYRHAISLTQNPIYNALKRKRDQLKRSGYPGLRGIILCDGDCEQLKSADAIIKYFLSNTSSISFVAVACLSGHRFSRATQPNRVSVRGFVNPELGLDRRLPAIIKLLESELPRQLPNARDDVHNAIIHWTSGAGRYGLAHFGGWSFKYRPTFGGSSMRISCRALHALLAGYITLEYFAESNGLSLTDNSNPFRQLLSDGCLLRSARVELSEEEDDDWIVFEFGPSDPAISPFRAKKQ